MNKRLGTEMNGLVCNLRNGCRILFFQRTDLDEYHLSHDQVFLLASLYSVFTFVGSYFLSLPKPEINIIGLATVATQLFAIALTAYVISRLSKTPNAAFPLYIVLLSVWPLFYLVWLMLGVGTNFSLWEFYGDQKYFYILYNIWLLAVVACAAAHVVGFNAKNIAKCIAAYVLVLAIPLHYLVVGQFWHLAYDYDAFFDKYASVNQENTYYRQFDFIDDFKISTLPERPGISDIYFAGFGSYGEQDVFMKEVKYVKHLFDERYDTKGRSVALINNLKTIDQYPLASKNNLSMVLDHFGTLLNPDEDVLFLYLTSHGSKKHELSVDLMPLTLNTIDPDNLKQMLDNSGIKYRVLLVSACYSGGFIAPLKNEYTLIMTASAPDKQSFGCGNKSEFTYFGKAVFEEQLRTNYNFIDAFGKSIESISAREKNEKHEPSNPQLFVGEKIKEKLEKLSHELEKFNRNKSVHLGANQ